MGWLSSSSGCCAMVRKTWQCIERLGDVSQARSAWLPARLATTIDASAGGGHRRHVIADVVGKVGCLPHASSYAQPAGAIDPLNNYNESTLPCSGRPVTAITAIPGV